MASALKRKRAPVEVLGTPKRAKSDTTQPAKQQRNPFETAGWDAAFNPAPEAESLKIKRSSLNDEETNGQLGSPEPIDFETFMDEDSQNGMKEEPAVSARKEKKRKPKTPAELDMIAEKKQARFLQKLVEPWRLSEPIGGRMINADPVFTQDEKYVPTIL
jgi:NET1-associated nuclear protein 1 (U3 small nucleolar RNA-associated protein 17)